MVDKSDKSRPFSIERDGKVLKRENLASALNEFNVSVNSDIPPFNQTSLQAFLPATNDIATIQPYEVCNKLRELKIHKAAGPNKILNRVLWEFFCSTRTKFFCSTRIHCHHLLTNHLSLVLYPEFGKMLTSFQYQDKPPKG